MIEKWVIKIQVDGKLRPVGELLYTEDILWFICWERCKLCSYLKIMPSVIYSSTMKLNERHAIVLIQTDITNEFLGIYVYY